MSRQGRYGYDKSRHLAPPWLPDERTIERQILRWFAPVRDRFECVRVKTIGETVALACGIKWSAALAIVVRRVLTRLGVRLCTFNGKHLATGIRPEHFDRDDAVKLSMKLRERKYPPRDDARTRAA